MHIDVEPELDEHSDTYEAISGIHALTSDRICTLHIIVGEEDIFFTVYDDDTMDTREEQREKTECRTPQEIANIVANLISPAVQRHLTPKPD